MAASPDNLSRINAGSMPLLDAEGLAARLGVTARFVRRLVEERRIPYLARRGRRRSSGHG